MNTYNRLVAAVCWMMRKNLLHWIDACEYIRQYEQNKNPLMKQMIIVRVEYLWETRVGKPVKIEKE